MIYVYTIGCPACNVLVKKLIEKDLPATLVQDERVFEQLGIDVFPMMRIDNGPLMTLAEAIAWIKTQEVKK